MTNTHFLSGQICFNQTLRTLLSTKVSIKLTVKRQHVPGNISSKIKKKRT